MTNVKTTRLDDALGLETIFSAKYLVLVEYVEVVLPFVYSFFRVALYHMPNSKYYPSLSGIASAHFYSSVLNVLAYGSLEFSSLILVILVLRHTLGFSSVSQLAFVLERQVGMIQTKLTLWFVYVMQVPLKHFGVDFSFQFAWLHKK